MLAFHRMMSGVVPLDRSHLPTSRLPSSLDVAAETARTLAAKEAESVRERLRMLVDGASRFETSDDGRRVEGRRVEVPADAVRNLRRGLYPIDARLDLHGFRSEDARKALGEFLALTHAKGERCVLVVHGKGAHSAGGVAVLRGEIAAWLSQGRPSEHVSAFATAREEDGGEGAVYVLLRPR